MQRQRFSSESDWGTSNRTKSSAKHSGREPNDKYSLERRKDRNLRNTPRVRLTNLRNRSRSPVPEFKRLSLRNKDRDMVRLENKDLDDKWRKGFRSNSRNAKNCPCLRFSGKKALYERPSLRRISFEEPIREGRRGKPSKYDYDDISDIPKEKTPKSYRVHHRRSNATFGMKFDILYDSSDSEASDSEEQVSPPGRYSGESDQEYTDRRRDRSTSDPYW